MATTAGDALLARGNLAWFGQLMIGISKQAFSKKPRRSAAKNQIEPTQPELPQIIEAQVVDETEALPVGPPCRACGCPRQAGARFCVACGLPFEVPREVGPNDLAAPRESDAEGQLVGDTHTFRCNNCGAEVATQSDQRSYFCPFCDSNYVAELDTSSSNRQRPEFIIGFSVTHEQAQAKFMEWLGKNSFFRPSDLSTKALSEKQRGVYLPFWHFTKRAESRWSAVIGQHWYRTEVYTTRDAKGNTVTRTRRVQETEWWPLSGNFHKFYFGFLVSASRGLPQTEALAIQPFQLTALVRYRPFYLAGWLSEEYSVAPHDAVEIAEKEFRQRQIRAIERFLPGDTFRELQVSTQFDTGGSDLILLPVHVLSYRYRDRVYRFLVNGQTGKYVGEKPWSATKITIFVVAVCLVLVILALIIMAFAQF